MHSSNSNNIPISYSDHPFLQRPFLNDIISSTSVFQFPSPFEDDDVYNLLHHPSSSLTQTTVANMVESTTKTHITEQIPRKRCSKRDRHSKINTARGPRDRRMRLSLDVARKFFGLQDMLGYDKASKTVEWLLVQAKAEIKKLAREINRSTACSFASSTSDQSCEVVSGVDDHDQPQAGGTGTGSVSEEKASRAAKEKKIRQWRKCAFHPLARESRERARARARERTREKLRSRRVVVDDLMETQSHSLKPATSFKPAEDNMVNDDSLVIIGTWSPSVIFSSEFLNNTAISQEHQLGDFQFFGKPWDG